MNSEKLDYNYQVLQKRNEENVIINNQQKRRVARLHEAIGRTRRGLKNLYNTGKRNIARLSSDIYKLHSNINDMESKAHQARLNNREKFDRIWEINYKELNLLVDRVYHIDRIIHEQQLAMPWSVPCHLFRTSTRRRKSAITFWRSLTCELAGFLRTG